MRLVHDCTILEIGMNFDRLYAGNDPDYELMLQTVRDRVHASRRAAEH